MKSHSDRQLISNYLKGDEKSLEVLIKRYLKPIYSFVFRFVSNIQDAEDITQEVFIKVWRNLKRFDQNGKFKTWIFTITKNTCLDWLRRKQQISFSELETDDEKSFVEKIPDSQSLPNELLEKKDFADLLNRAIKKLSPKYKMILFLRYNDHLTFRQISEILEKPLNTVKSYHRRALILLRNYLKKVEKINFNI